MLYIIIALAFFFFWPGEQHYRSKCFCLCWYLHFSLSILQSISLYQRHSLQHWGNDSIESQAQPLHSQWVVWVLYSSLRSCGQLVESNLLFLQQTWLFGDYHGTFSPTTQLDVTSPDTGSFIWWQEKAGWDTISPLFGTSLGQPLCILGSFHFTVFPYHPSNSDQFEVLSLSHLHFPSHSLLIMEG